VSVRSGHPNAFADELEVVIRRDNFRLHGQAGIEGERAMPKRHRHRRKTVLLNTTNYLQKSRGNQTLLQ
jgi:hypothetical protein